MSAMSVSMMARRTSNKTQDQFLLADGSRDTVLKSSLIKHLEITVTKEELIMSSRRNRSIIEKVGVGE